MQLWALIVDSFRESLERKTFWLLLAMTGLVCAAMFCVRFEAGAVDILFGLWRFETTRFGVFNAIDGKSVLDVQAIASLLVFGITDFFVGWLGVMLALVGSASLFTSMLERGTVDVVLSKPISRNMLFLGKYAGAMTFVAVQAAIFVGATFLVAGLRWGVWLPGYLWAAPLMVVLFSYVYCVSVLAAVTYRSSLAAILLSLGAWTLFAGVQITVDAIDSYPSIREGATGQAVYRVFNTARWIVPKTQDVTYLAGRWSGALPSSELADYESGPHQQVMRNAAAVEADRMRVSAWSTIGSSLLFEAAIVLWAMWKFSRQDF